MLGIYFQPPISPKFYENIRKEFLACSLKNIYLNEHDIYLHRGSVVFKYSSEKKKTTYFSHQNPMQISWIILSATGKETVYVSLRVFSVNGTASKCQHRENMWHVQETSAQ